MSRITKCISWSMALLAPCSSLVASANEFRIFSSNMSMEMNIGPSIRFVKIWTAQGWIHFEQCETTPQALLAVSDFKQTRFADTCRPIRDSQYKFSDFMESAKKKNVILKNRNAVAGFEDAAGVVVFGVITGAFGFGTFVTSPTVAGAVGCGLMTAVFGALTTEMIGASKDEFRGQHMSKTQLGTILNQLSEPAHPYESLVMSARLFEEGTVPNSFPLVEAIGNYLGSLPR